VVADKKYYWLKMKRDFFKRHDIRIIEKITNNGKDYLIFYLKLLLESIDHEGFLRFSDTIPYNEEMLSVITDTNIDIVKAAMSMFINLGMIEILDDETIYMRETEKLIGCETSSAERVRNHREKQKMLQCNTDVTSSNKNVTQSKSKRKSLEKEIDIDVVVEEDSNGNENENVENLEYMGGTLGKGVVLLSDKQRDALIEELGFDAFNHYIDKLSTFIIEKEAKVSNHYATIRKWAKEDSKI
jgi:predicted phage replisome organizer